MLNKNQISKLVGQAIEELNLSRPADQHISVQPGAVLFGRGGALDSLALVNLIVAVEQRIADESGIYITIADARAMSQTRSPFASIEALVDYVAMLLAEQA